MRSTLLRSSVNAASPRFARAAASVASSGSRTSTTHSTRSARPDFEPRAAQSLVLDRIVRVAEARRIDDRDGQTVEREMLAERIARRARNVRHDRGVVTRQPIQKTRLARVRRPRDRHGESVAQHGARARGACECVELAPAARRAQRRTRRSRRTRISSSGKSSHASIRTRRCVSACCSSGDGAENSPSSERSAARAAATEPLATRSAMASACTRSILSFRNARSVNSPGSAGRAPSAIRGERARRR